MSNDWKVEKTFSTYEEAAELKNTLQQSSRGATLQLKIKRCEEASKKEIFVLKSRTDPSLLKAIEEVEQKLLKR
jgi:hypothetical protein